MRNAGHWHPAGTTEVFGRERDPGITRDQLRVIIERFVEIAEAKSKMASGC
jgi:hypothetical protein